MGKTLLQCSWKSATQTSRKSFALIIKESQNHWAWRAPWRSHSSTHLPEQDQLKQVGQNSVQIYLSILNDGECTTSLGYLCQCLTVLKVKHPVFLLFKQKSLCFNLYLLLHVLLLGTTGPVSSFFTLPSGIYTH